MAFWASLQGLTCKHGIEPVLYHAHTTVMITMASTAACPAGSFPVSEQHSILSQEDACLHRIRECEHANRPATSQACLAAGEALLAPVRVDPPLPLLEEGTSELVR